MSADKPKKTAGRPPKALVIEGDWQDAVKSALAKGKPPAPAKKAKKAAKKTGTKKRPT